MSHKQVPTFVRWVKPRGKEKLDMRAAVTFRIKRWREKEIGRQNP